MTNEWREATDAADRADDLFKTLGIKTPAPVGIHLNGVRWQIAPLPRRLHRCKAQSIGLSWEFCACGAKRAQGRGRGFWFDKNSRRKA